MEESKKNPLFDAMVKNFAQLAYVNSSIKPRDDSDESGSQSDDDF